VVEPKDPRTYAIIGAAMEVYCELGCGFLEAVYHEALWLEFKHRQIPCRHEVELPIFYKRTPLRTFYRADFICYDAVLVEIKALDVLTGSAEAQILNYLKATGL
jgi:GxxExxY protein